MQPQMVRCQAWQSRAGMPTQQQVSSLQGTTATRDRAHGGSVRRGLPGEGGARARSAWSRGSWLSKAAAWG